MCKVTLKQCGLCMAQHVLFFNVILYISTDVCMLRLVVMSSITHFKAPINILSCVCVFFLFCFLFGYCSVMVQHSIISAADSRYHLDVYISKVLRRCQKFVFRNCHVGLVCVVRSVFVSLPIVEAETQRPNIGQIASIEHSSSR